MSRQLIARAARLAVLAAGGVLLNLDGPRPRKKKAPRVIAIGPVLRKALDGYMAGGIQARSRLRRVERGPLRHRETRSRSTTGTVSGRTSPASVRCRTAGSMPTTRRRPIFGLVKQDGKDQMVSVRIKVDGPQSLRSRVDHRDAAGRWAQRRAGYGTPGVDKTPRRRARRCRLASAARASC